MDVAVAASDVAIASDHSANGRHIFRTGDEAGSDSLAATQAVLPISLIATPRSVLSTCGLEERVSAVLARYPAFDHIPVTEGGRPEDRIIGLLDVHRYRGVGARGKVQDDYVPLREEHLIGSDAPILDFILNAGERDCRLLVSGTGISGLVTLSDLQALPVRASLFTLVTRLELVMAERIKSEFDGSKAGWLGRLSPGRRQKLDQQIEAAKGADAFVDALLFTQFADKVSILRKSSHLSRLGRQFAREMKAAQDLRNALAHANQYASTRPSALKLCWTVRTILSWITVLSTDPQQT